MNNLFYQILTHYLFYNNGIENIKNRIKKKNSWKFLGILTGHLGVHVHVKKS